MLGSVPTKNINAAHNFFEDDLTLYYKIVEVAKKNSSKEDNIYR